MKNYNLKDKIHITKDFLSELASKSWQEIEQLQSQISNIEIITEQDKKLVNLLDTLLTSYYIFTGGLENLSSDTDCITAIEDDIITQDIQNEPVDDKVNFSADLLNVIPKVQVSDNTDIDYEPFEYFVDFDEPIGDPISDDDLYGN